MTGDHIGRSLHRLEDERFLTGRGCYVDDVAVPGQLHGVVLRSPHGHALIECIDTAPARAMPGVHGVFTAADLDADGIGTLPCIARVATVAPMIVPRRPALARDRVRHVGDPVAFVVADTAELARDAAERVNVAYRPLPAVVEASEALAAQRRYCGMRHRAICRTGSSAATNQRSRRRSPRLRMSSRSSWSTIGWSSPRSSRAPRSAPTIRRTAASTCS